MLHGLLGPIPNKEAESLSRLAVEPPGTVHVIALEGLLQELEPRELGNRGLLVSTAIPYKINAQTHMYVCIYIYVCLNICNM